MYNRYNRYVHVFILLSVIYIIYKYVYNKPEPIQGSGNNISTKAPRGPIDITDTGIVITDTVVVITSSGIVKSILTYPDSKVKIKDRKLDITYFGYSGKLSLDLSYRAGLYPGLGYRLVFYREYSFGVGITYNYAYLKIRRRIVQRLFRDVGIYAGYGVTFLTLDVRPWSVGIDVGL